MGTVTWAPIGGFPNKLRFGQDVLLWDGETAKAYVGFWQDSGPNAGGWESNDGDVLHPSHFAEIGSPV